MTNDIPYLYPSTQFSSLFASLCICTLQFTMFWHEYYKPGGILHALRHDMHTLIYYGVYFVICFSKHGSEVFSYLIDRCCLQFSYIHACSLKRLLHFNETIDCRFTCSTIDIHLEVLHKNTNEHVCNSL
jgi:hypothetical protein